MQDEILIFAKTLFGEARGEGLKGIEAVANVIMNRVKHARKIGSFWWGKTIEEVCLKPFQFSCWNADDVNRALLDKDMGGDLIFGICERVARRAVAGLLPDNTNGATHYHTKTAHPKWAHAAVPCAEIGGHLFYAEI